MTQSRKRTFYIPKKAVYEAYKKVKASGGSSGSDGITIEKFEENLENNLYKIWNRMSSGSYFPKLIKRVCIPKKGGGTRSLGLPCVSDKIAQTVVKDLLEPGLERIFNRNSFGYRPGKSCHDAIMKARNECWKKDWVIDLDIKGFFDNIDHDLMMKAVKHCTKCKWAILYIERWLKNSIIHKKQEIKSERGTPQGGVISPLLANLFLHFTFDKWMEIHFSNITFERFSDDIICHCYSLKQAEYTLGRLKSRFGKCKLTLHPAKTKIVYCKDSRRKGDYENVSFDFLGFTFKIRSCKDRRGRKFQGFNPSISMKSRNAILVEVRKWKLNNQPAKQLEDIAKMLNPQIRGWINYFTKFRWKDTNGIWILIEKKIMKWAIRKYKKLKNNPKRVWVLFKDIYKRDPMLFAHWEYVYKYEKLLKQ